MSLILLVEDDPLNRDMLSRRISRLGHDVLPASDGLQAVELAGSQLPDLIVLDLRLPNVDGWEAARRIRANPATASIPIIAITAYAMSGERQKALAAGCDDFEVKPLNFASLASKMSRFLRTAGHEG